MSPPALLLRCLLIVTFCLDGSLSLWTSSAMAATQAQHMPAGGGAQAATAGADCEDGDQQGERAASHEDCDCGSGACGCACAFPVAAITHALPFLAQHALATRPAVVSLATEPLGSVTPVFRPPIG